MKILIIIIILIILIIIFAQIKVYPKQEEKKDKKPTENKTKEYFKQTEKRALPSSKDLEYYNKAQGSCNLPSARELMRLVQEEHLNTQYKFNIATQPVTTIVPNRFNEDTQSHYLNKIRKFVNNWNKIFDEYYGVKRNEIKILDINLLFIQETMTEFVIKANVKISYLGRELYMRLSFYGWIDRSDDPHFGEKDHYYMQMFDLAPIKSEDYAIKPEVSTSSWDDTFSSYERDKKYAEKIRKMHQDEHFNAKRT